VSRSPQENRSSDVPRRKGMLRSRQGLRRTAVPRIVRVWRSARTHAPRRANSTA
jgi:hypothetical protein